MRKNIKVPITWIMHEICFKFLFFKFVIIFFYFFFLFSIFIWRKICSQPILVVVVVVWNVERWWEKWWKLTIASKRLMTTCVWWKVIADMTWASSYEKLGVDWVYRWKWWCNHTSFTCQISQNLFFFLNKREKKNVLDFYIYFLLLSLNNYYFYF